MFKKDSNDHDTEQKLAHEVRCSTFLLKLLGANEPADEIKSGNSHEVQDKVRTIPNTQLNLKKCDITKHLKAIGGGEKTLMILKFR